MRVEQLPSYGHAFDYLPLAAQLQQVKFLLVGFRKRFGVFGALRFLVRVFRVQAGLQRQFSAIISTKYPGVPASALNELYMLTAMYKLLTEAEDKSAAYDFILNMLRDMGPAAHEALYDVAGLRKCDGEIYKNFCALNRSVFENSAAKGFYDVDEIRDSENLQYVRLTKCLNIELFSILGYPELGRVGCEIDKGGYAPDAIEDKVDLDFRRPHTLINGDAACECYHYRKGHAPADMATL